MEIEESCCVLNTGEESRKDYWDTNFRKVETPNWIETGEPWIMAWIELVNLSKEAVIFCAGVGDSNIVETLQEKGYKNIIANDISEVAIEKLRKKNPQSEITYLVDDLINPSKIQAFHGKVDLYIDRATLHFFTTCPEKDHYFEQMGNLLKPGGYSMLGVSVRTTSLNVVGLICNCGVSRLYKTECLIISIKNLLKLLSLKLMATQETISTNFPKRINKCESICPFLAGLKPMIKDSLVGT